jgi:hypothetical protein
MTPRNAPKREIAGCYWACVGTGGSRGVGLGWDISYNEFTFREIHW